LVDLVGLAGGLIVAQVHEDIGAFLRAIPRDRCKYMLEIPHFSRSYAVEERERLAAAFAAYDRGA
jgi:hypothetical protein